MDNITIYDIEQGSEAWHQLRCGRFTASKFSVLMGKQSGLTYKGLINSKVGEIISQSTEPSYSNDTMQRGIDLEPFAAKLYDKIKEVETTEVGFVTNELFHPDYVGISPDRYVGEKGILEIKCPMMKTHIGYLRENRLPNEYKWQVQGQLLITEAKYCDFMSFYPEIKPFIIRVYNDEVMQGELKDRFNESIQLVKDIITQINN